MIFGLKRRIMDEIDALQKFWKQDRTMILLVCIPFYFGYLMVLAWTPHEFSAWLSFITIWFAYLIVLNKFWYEPLVKKRDEEAK